MADPTLTSKPAPQGQLALDLEPEAQLSGELEVDEVRLPRVELIIAGSLVFAILAIGGVVLWGG
jgi:hypothetical protein